MKLPSAEPLSLTWNEIEEKNDVLVNFTPNEYNTMNS